MVNNEAFFAKLVNISPIEGADKIVRADVAVNGITITQVVTGVGTPEGQAIVYFDSNMCLSEAVLEKYPELGNYLSKNGRVKVVKLRGCISNGLAVEFDKFKVWDKKLAFKEGDSFLEINGTEICKKYVPIIKVSEMGCGCKNKKGKKESRMIPGQFNFHINTSQFFRNAFSVNPESVISISRKFHGTSFIVSNCLVKKKLSVRDRIAKFLGVNVIESEFDDIAASRSVVKNGTVEKAGFYKEDIWTSIKDNHFKGRLQPGETIYGEAVGYLKSGKMIQKDYSYGCKEYEHKILVYRITKTDAGGNVTELSWQAMKDRCLELNVPMVTEYYFGKAGDLFDIPKDDAEWNIKFAEKIREEYLEKIADDCGKKIPDEGVVIRIEGNKINAHKAKSEAFYLKESKTNETEENIDEAN